jgi:protein-S-isoprenylcysteine O-methyltransferase Ste14
LAATAFFLAAHRAFINFDNFFFIAGLIGRRREADFFADDAAFFGARWPVCFAHHAFFAVPILALAGEEKLLARDLEGYKEYLQKVRYRLVPHVW